MEPAEAEKKPFKIPRKGTWELEITATKPENTPSKPETMNKPEKIPSKPEKNVEREEARAAAMKTRANAKALAAKNNENNESYEAYFQKMIE